MDNRFLDKMVGSLCSLPGIGKKSAYRIAFYLLRADEKQFDSFIKNIAETRQNLQFCQKCGGISENSICSICTSDKRNHTLVCIVEQPEDIFFIENSGEFEGVYHVLNGVISPLDGVGPEQLRIRELLERIESSEIEEILLATNPTMEGDATASYLHSRLKEKGIRVTRIAHGITVGGTIEYADQYTLGKAIKSRLTL